MIEFWAGPSCIDTTARGLLDSLGIRPWSASLDHAPENCVVIYSTPDAALSDSCAQTIFPPLARLASEGRRACADWRLAALSLDQCGTWLEGNMDALSIAPDTGPPHPSALLAAVTRQWLFQVESTLHAYLDLELHSALFATSADTGYLQRLQSAIAPAELLHEWRSCAANPSVVAELDEAREECDLTLMQLHRTQEELEKAATKKSTLSSRAIWLEKKLAEKDQIIGGYEQLLETVHVYQRRTLLPAKRQ